MLAVGLCGCADVRDLPQQHRSQQHLVEGGLLNGRSTQAHHPNTCAGQDRGALPDQSLEAKQHLQGEDKGRDTEDRRQAGHRGKEKEQLNDPWLVATGAAEFTKSLLLW